MSPDDTAGRTCPRIAGSLTVGIALAVNVALFATLGWMNRDRERERPAERWTVQEVCFAVPPAAEPELLPDPADPATEPEPQPQPMELAEALPQPAPAAAAWTPEMPPLPACPCAVPTTAPPPGRSGPPARTPTPVARPAPATSAPATAAAIREPTGPMTAEQVDRPPQKSAGEPPAYPRWARRTNAEGTVTLRFLVTPEGEPRDVTVVNVEGDLRFGDAAAEALAEWRFLPGMHRGRVVAVWCTQRIRFRLEE